MKKFIVINGVKAEAFAPASKDIQILSNLGQKQLAFYLLLKLGHLSLD